MAILAVLFAIYCVKNTTQDLIYAITGRVPPSFVREQQRVKLAREALAARANSRPLRQPVTPGRGSRKFFRNAYNDAWETAEERRARWSAKRAKKRHEKWDAEEDGTPAPIETNARPEGSADLTPSTYPEPPIAPTPVVHDDDRYVLGTGGKKETLYQRYAMRRRNDGQPMTAVAIADELGMTVAESEKLQTRWATRYEQETATGADRPPQHLLDFQKHGRCRDCGGEVTLDKDLERPGQWIVGVAHNREDCPQDAKRLTLREQHDQQVQQLAEQASQDARGDDRPSGSTSPTKENELTTNTETTGLQSGLTYNAAMAEKCEEGATSVEQSIAALENGEVGPSVTGPMQQGRELLESAQACFQQAHDELQSHITVQEAYNATPDAGNKQFVTAE